MKIAGIVVAFAIAFVPGGTASGQDTTRVSVDSSGVQGDLRSAFPSLSADGSLVAFWSLASNLVAGDTNGMWDVFVRDRSTALTERVSVSSAGVEGNNTSYVGAISADGRFVAFESDATNLVANDANGRCDVFIRDRSNGITERVSIDSSGSEGNGNSGFNGVRYSASVSSDGRYVAFESYASNLVAGDTNGVGDVFVHDRSTGITERISVDSSGIEGNGESSLPSISSDGRFVAFRSLASNLVAGDTNKTADIFVHDRATGITERVSVDSSGGQGDGWCDSLAISADGGFVAFDTLSTLAAGDVWSWDVYVHDRATGATELVSVNSSGQGGTRMSVEPSISAGGEIVAFKSLAANLVPGDTNATHDVFVHDRSTGLTERVSVDSSGAQADSYSEFPSISSNGQVVAFGSFASNLVAGDTNGIMDVFVHELCSIPASWSNYGAGFPGTLGVPAFTSLQNPTLGSSITLFLDNSYGNPTAGMLFIGFQRASIHSRWGGDLLVAPALIESITLQIGGDSFSGDIPQDWLLCGVTIDLQAIEADPGAANGVSFTQGLELVLGH